MIHRPLALFTSLVLAVCTFVGIANGGQVIVSYQVPPADREQTLYDFNVSSGPLDPNLAVTIPSFDDTLGTLTSVRIITNMTPTWFVRAENESIFPITPAQPVTWFTQTQTVWNYRPSTQNPYDANYAFNMGVGVSSVNAQGTINNLSAYDGVTDYAGTSGIQTNFGASGLYTHIFNLTTTRQRELDWFSSGTTRTIFASTRALPQSWNGWPGHWSHGLIVKMNFASDVLVTYTYQ